MSPITSTSCNLMARPSQTLILSMPWIHVHPFRKPPPFPQSQHPSPQTSKSSTANRIFTLSVKVMFRLAGNQLKPANQDPRTKCFCLHLEYLNAAELPHVNLREIVKKSRQKFRENQNKKRLHFIFSDTEYKEEKRKVRQLLKS